MLVALNFPNFTDAKFVQKFSQIRYCELCLKIYNQYCFYLNIDFTFLEFNFQLSISCIPVALVCK